MDIKPVYYYDVQQIIKEWCWHRPVSRALLEDNNIRFICWLISELNTSWNAEPSTPFTLLTHAILLEVLKMFIFIHTGLVADLLVDKLIELY